MHVKQIRQMHMGGIVTAINYSVWIVASPTEAAPADMEVTFPPCGAIILFVAVTQDYRGPCNWHLDVTEAVAFLFIMTTPRWNAKQYATKRRYTAPYITWRELHFVSAILEWVSDISHSIRFTNMRLMDYRLSSDGTVYVISTHNHLLRK
jgi:hypothetical protein